MSIKNIDKINYVLSGQLQKLSSSILIGYQPKFFSLLENGTKIGYRNLNETEFKEDKTFFIKEVSVCEAEEEFSFTLETAKRSYTLKARDEITKLVWMRTIVSIRKMIIRKRSKLTKSIEKFKIIASTTQNTLPNISTQFLQPTQRSMHGNLRITDRSMRLSSNYDPSGQKDTQTKSNFSVLLNTLPQYFVKYNTFITTLRTRVQNLFTATFNESIYILFSSKCLYPLTCQSISQDNLTNMMLPPWAEVNKMYKLTGGNNQQPKLLLQIGKIIDIEQPKEEKTCLRVRTQQMVHSFYCQTVEQRDRLRQKFMQGIENLKEVSVMGKLTRKNYDNLIRLYNEKYDEFLVEMKKTIEKLVPNDHQFNSQTAIKRIDAVIPWIQQFVLIVGNKTKSCSQMMLLVIKQLHQEIKVLIKLTWDCSNHLMKGQDILKFLNALAAYHTITKPHLTDLQFMTGMKQLSKIYVRQAWKNFQDIILGIVQQQKKQNFFNDQDNQYIQTNAVIDLFKFIYEVFDLAAPCWQHKLHLHNVQRLMCRAMSVFVGELKAAVDETVMGNRQLIAITNNYFRFSITVDQFYSEKFSQLQQKTREAYEQLKTDYKELSNIILDKLAFDVRVSIKRYFQKASFFKLEVQKLCQILRQSSENIQVQLFHPVFVKRFYEKLFTAVREGILSLLEKEVSSKKKHNVPKLLQTLDTLSFDLLDISQVLYNGKSKIDKQLNQVNILLSCQNHNQLIKLIKGAGEDIRRIYLNIINLREDYYIGGPLYYLLNDSEAERSSTARGSYHMENNSVYNNNKPAAMLTPSMKRQLRGASFSSYYLNHEFDNHSSVDKSEQDYDEPLKLISQGYLMKCKTNKKVWQKEYFRLKNGTLYFFQTEKSERCQNSILVTDMNRVYAGGPTQGLCFTIEYISLHREKYVELKCDTVELKERWLESLCLELKRVKNDEKMKRQKLKLNQKSKNCLIIDYEELGNGKGYFSYANAKG